MARPRKAWQPKLTAAAREVRRVVGYVRVSTEEQIDGFGLAAQEEAIRNYCSAAGYELVSIERDEGLSGTLPPAKRPGLAAVLELVGQGAVDGVVVRAADRIARKTSLFLTLTEHLDSAGVNFYSATQPEMSSKVARAIFGILGELERDGINSRTASGRQQKAAQGGYAGGRVPFGYRLVGSRRDARWVVDDAEAAIVREIFERRAAGETFAAIADELNRRGVAAPRSAAWRTAGVYVIVNNPAYTGVRRWREGTEIMATGEYPPIVSGDLFRDGQAA